MLQASTDRCTYALYRTHTCTDLLAAVIENKIITDMKYPYKYLQMPVQLYVTQRRTEQRALPGCCVKKNPFESTSCTHPEYKPMSKWSIK